MKFFVLKTVHYFNKDAIGACQQDGVSGKIDWLFLLPDLLIITND